MGAMDYAFYVARNGRPGPVFIDLPKDLQIQQLTDDMIGTFLDGLGSYVEDTESNQKSNEEFVRLIPDTTAIRLGRAEEGLSFQVNSKGELVHVESGHDAYHLDHHNTDMIYKGVDYEHIYEQKAGRAMGKLGAEEGLMAEVMTLIKNAKRPFIIAGQGCNDASEELMELAEALQVPVATTLHALGTFDERHPLATNMLGMHGHATPNYLIQDCDLLICIGSRFDDRITGRMPDFVPSPGKKFLQAVNSQIRENPPKDTYRTKQWIERKCKLEEENPVKITRYPAEKFTIQSEDGTTKEVLRSKICTQGVISEMNRQLSESGKIDEAIFSTGVGIHQ